MPANLNSTYPTDDFLLYVNAPIGKGEPVPDPFKPLFAIPTTAGTGSKTTRALGADVDGIDEKDGGEVLAQTMIDYFKKFNLPNRLKDVVFTEADIPKLVEGTLPQHRVTKLSPRSAGLDELAGLFKYAMQYW